jgi:phage terminase large subunit
MKITLDRSAYSAKFHNIIHSWDRYLIAAGGRGSGKTDSFFIKYLLSLFEPYYFKLAYINKEGSNIRDQQYAGFKRVAKRIGLLDKLKFYDGDYRIVHPNGNMLVPKGMDDPEKTKGLDDITAVWWDEINKGTIEDFRALNELLRSPMAKYLQFAMSFNPVAETHWLRSTFFDPEDRWAVHPDFKGQLLLNRSTYNDNEFIDRKAYLETLLMSAAGNKNVIRVNIEGDWGVEENDNPWLYNWDEDKFVKEVPFLPSYDVYLSFDFNNDPFACTAWQMSPNKGMPNSFLHCVREFSGMMKVEEMCQRIRTTFPGSVLHVTGDRSGQNEDVGRNQNLYQSIAALLNLSTKQLDLNTVNLEHADSRMLCNTMLFHYPNFYIDRSCKVLIEQCRNARIDDKSSKPAHLLKNREDHKNDSFDSFRYLLQTYFNKFVKETYLRVKNK